MSPTAQNETAASTMGGWPRAALYSLLGVVCIGAWLAWLSRGAVTPIYGDASIYVSLTRSLAEGHYRDNYLIGSPPHAQYPPGMPGWLLLIRAIAGSGLAPALAGNVLLVALTAVMCGDGTRRLSNPWLGVIVAAMIIFNPPLIALTAQLRSEILFSFFCTAALWLTLVDAQAARRSYPALILAATIAAFLTRSAGIALIPAILLVFLYRRQWRSAVIGAVLSAGVVVAWFAYTRWATPQTVARTYTEDFAAVAPVAEPVKFVAHLVSNGRTFFAQLASVQFGIPDIHNQPLDNLLWGLVLLVPALIGLLVLSRKWPAMVLFVVFTAGMMLIFPWPLTRLLTIMVPWLAITMLFGWIWIATRLHWKRTAAAAMIAGVALSCVGAIRRVEAATRMSSCRARAPFEDPRCYRNEDRAYAQALAFIRDSLPANGVIATSRTASSYLIAERQTLPLEILARTSLERVMRPTGPVTVILLSRLLPFEYELIGPRLSQVCTQLTVRATYANGTLVLLRREGEARDACSALSEYNRVSATYTDDNPE